VSVVSMRTKTTVRHEYIVPDPAAYGDLLEAIQFAKRDAAEAGKDTSYDDSLHVTHDGDNLIVFWEVIQ
jgi:hypothetical protein